MQLPYSIILTYLPHNKTICTEKYDGYILWSSSLTELFYLKDTFIKITNYTWDITSVFTDSQAYELVPSFYLFQIFLLFCKWMELFNTMFDVGQLTLYKHLQFKSSTSVENKTL